MISHETLKMFGLRFSFCEGELRKYMWEPGPVTGKEISSQG